MASATQSLTTYYAKRIIGDTAAADETSALLQTGAGVATDTWILHRTNRNNIYGIKYLYDNSTGGQADKIELYGDDTPTAWVELDTGDMYIMGKVGIGYDPNTTGNLYKLYVDGNVYFDDTTYLNGNVGIGYDPATSGNTYKLYVNGSTNITGTITLGDHLYLAAAKNIYMNYNSTDYGVLINYDNSNTSLNACGGGIHIGYINSPYTYIFYSPDGSTRTKFFEVNSNGAFAATRFGVNGQNTNYTLYVNGTITATDTIYANGGYLKSTSNDNTVTIGSQNTGWCHIQNSANISFYFNKAVHVDGDVYRYNTKVHMSSSGFHPPKNGGIYWDPYVESASDASDVTQIVQIASGVAGGTELRIQQANDANDVINLMAHSHIYMNSKKAFTISDSWLRINEDKGFSSGIYTGSSIIRSDAGIWGQSVVINSNWVGFYNVVQGTTRYGYVQCNADRMYFVKENSKASQNYYFSFNSVVQSSGEFITAGSQGFRLLHNNRGAFWHWNASSGQQWFYLMFTAAGRGYGSWTSVRAFYANADTGYTYHTRAYSAVWNDYAEFRSGECTEPGRVVIEQKSGIMTKCQERLCSGAKVISDTYGFAIGETKQCKTPIAVSGRVLVYPYQDKNKYELGAAVCSAPNGTVDIMTRNEIMMYPERIIGTVSEIPDYEEWQCGGDVQQGPRERVKVNGRIWIYVK